MTTATQYPAAPVVAPAKAAPAAVPFETRLELAGVGIDTLMSVAAGDALAEANAAATAAVLEAQSTVDPTPQWKPHPVLQQAAELIRTRGWVQGVYESPGGRLCAMAAIREALYGPVWTMTPSDHRERDAAYELMRRIKDDTGTAFSVPAWNDSRGSVEDVVRLMG